MTSDGKTVNYGNKMTLSVNNKTLDIIGVKTRNGLYGVDYMLMNGGKDLDCLQKDDELELIASESIASDTNDESSSKTSKSNKGNHIGNYEILQTIGKGGFSVVYVVR